MELVKISDGKLKIALSDGELLGYGLTVERFDYSNVETKKALWQMLDEAKKKVGFDASDASLYVELYPSRLGGCEIFVTKLKRPPMPPREAMKCAFSFEEAEAMIAACGALSVAGYRKPSELYIEDGRFYLVLEIEDGESVGLFDLVSEFGCREDSDKTARIVRKGRLLSKEPLSDIGRTLLHRT